MSVKTKNQKALLHFFLVCFAIANVLLFSDTLAASQKELDLSAYIINQKNKEFTNGDHEVRFAIYTNDRKKPTLILPTPIKEKESGKKQRP